MKFFAFSFTGRNSENVLIKRKDCSSSEATFRKIQKLDERFLRAFFTSCELSSEPSSELSSELLRGCFSSQLRHPGVLASDSEAELELTLFMDLSGVLTFSSNHNLANGSSVLLSLIGETGEANVRSDGSGLGLCLGDDAVGPSGVSIWNNARSYWSSFAQCSTCVEVLQLRLHILRLVTASNVPGKLLFRRLCPTFWVGTPACKINFWSVSKITHGVTS